MGLSSLSQRPGCTILPFIGILAASRFSQIMRESIFGYGTLGPRNVRHLWQDLCQTSYCADNRGKHPFCRYRLSTIPTLDIRCILFVCSRPWLVKNALVY